MIIIESLQCTITLGGGGGKLKSEGKWPIMDRSGPWPDRKVTGMVNFRVTGTCWAAVTCWKDRAGGGGGQGGGPPTPVARLGREAIVDSLGPTRKFKLLLVSLRSGRIPRFVTGLLWPDSEEEVGCRIQRQGNFAATGVCSDRLLWRKKNIGPTDRLAP